MRLHNVTADAQPKENIMASSPSILLQNVTLGAQAGIDVLIADGIITAIGYGISAPQAESLACQGALLLPSFVDPHVHLDKTRIGATRLRHVRTASVAERAANERTLRKQLAHDPFVYGANLLRRLALMGTTHVRSHIDVDPDTGLRHIEAALMLREKYREYMDIQLVAFPQSGILTSPGTLEYMEEALRMGVDCVGGLDPQVFDGDLHGHLDAVFTLAERHGKGIDLHLHEPGQTGLASLTAIIDRAKALGMKDKITISHGYALGQVPQSDLDRVLPQMAALGIAVGTSAPGAVAFPPVEALLQAGICYMGMSDNIQDMWSPWGNGDQLERAMLLAYRHGFRADDLILLCYDMVTRLPGERLGLQAHSLAGIQQGAPANLTAVLAEDLVSAVLQRPQRLFTMKAGRFTARGGAALLPE